MNLIYETCCYAAFGGHIKVLVWLLENSHITEGQYNELSHEFEGGHLNFMMLSLKNGCVSCEHVVVVVVISSVCEVLRNGEMKRLCRHT